MQMAAVVAANHDGSVVSIANRNSRSLHFDNNQLASEMRLTTPTMMRGRFVPSRLMLPPDKISNGPNYAIILAGLPDLAMVAA